MLLQLPIPLIWSVVVTYAVDDVASLVATLVVVPLYDSDHRHPGFPGHTTKQWHSCWSSFKIEGGSSLLFSLIRGPSKLGQADGRPYIFRSYKQKKHVITSHDARCTIDIGMGRNRFILFWHVLGKALLFRNCLYCVQNGLTGHPYITSRRGRGKGVGWKRDEPLCGRS